MRSALQKARARRRSSKPVGRQRLDPAHHDPNGLLFDVHRSQRRKHCPRCVCSGACQAREARPAKRQPGESGQRGSLTTRDLCLIVDGVADEPDGTVMRHLPEAGLNGAALRRTLARARCQKQWCERDEEIGWGHKEMTYDPPSQNDARGTRSS